MLPNLLGGVNDLVTERSNFEWITDDDGRWSEPAPEPPRPPRPRLRWQPSLLLLVLGLVAALWLWQQAQQRLQAATAVADREIQAAYQLYLRAAQNQDADLLRSLISGSSPAWVQAQLGLLAEDLLLGRWSMGLWPVANATGASALASSALASGGPEIVAVNPSPDLMAAEVVSRQRFTFVRADGREEQVVLEQSTHFRQGEERWLAAPPASDYWGEWRVKDGQRLSLIYPQREEALAGSLLLSLESELARACRRLRLPCSAADSYTVRLDTDPASLLQTADPAAMLGQQGIVRLPAPSLVGRPVDLAGERALRRAYAAHFITAVIIQNAGWRCCAQGLFHQALIDRQLAQLGLRPWPVQPHHYQQIVRDPMPGVYMLGRYWDEPPLRPMTDFAQPQLYTMLDVLLRDHPDLTAFEMQRSLVQFDSYRDWVIAHVGFTYFNRGRFQRAWLDAVQAQLPSLPAALPTPAQDVLLLCRRNSPGFLPELYRFDWETESWTLELSGRRLRFLAGLPGDEGVLLQERVQRRDLRAFTWVDGREQTIAVYPSQSAIFRVDAVGRDVLLYVFKFDENSAEFNLAYLEQCQEGGCDLAGFTQPPVRSPEGEWLLGSDDEERLWLRYLPREGASRWWHGRAPFWLDQDAYGYVAEQEIVVESLNGRFSPRAYSLAALAAALPAAPALQAWEVHSIVSDPDRADQLFVAVTYTAVAGDQTQRGTMVLRYELATEAATPLIDAADYFGLYNPFSFSPDGRWLNIQSYSDSGFDWQLDVLNLQTGRQAVYRVAQNVAMSGYDWSADGRWLLRVDQTFIHLSAPEFGYERLLPYDSVNCNFAAWVNKG